MYSEGKTKNDEYATTWENKEIRRQVIIANIALLLTLPIGFLVAFKW